VRFAHRIITLDDGRVIESGDHSQLLRNDGYYARVHYLQELNDAL
jgi:ABC-type multidrug transport system fused ATPase/permease subunit